VESCVYAASALWILIQRFKVSCCFIGFLSAFEKSLFTEARSSWSLNISNFKANKSPGYDDVLPKIVKSVIHTIAEPLSTATNVSFDQGTFPDALKLAKVGPISKSDDRTIVSNYRPVSVLSVFSKIYEKVMYKRLFGYFVENKFLVDNQFGFRKQYSTSMAILRLVDQIATEIDKGNLTMGVFIDLSKAFDSLQYWPSYFTWQTIYVWYQRQLLWLV